MSDSTQIHQARIEQIRELLKRFQLQDKLLDATQGDRHELETSLVHWQQTVELERRLQGLHAADLADLLESLGTANRKLVWAHVGAARRGDVLLELEDPVRLNLVEISTHDELLAALVGMDAHELAELSDALPATVMRQALERLESEDRNWVRESISYSDETVGHWMSREMLLVSDEQDLRSVLNLLRAQTELPPHTDKLFVIDSAGLLCGVLFVQDILLNPAETSVAQVMKSRTVRFLPDDEADDAARAFERYDLASAPVVNERGKPIGRLSVDAIMDFVREEADKDALNVAGVVESEDLFAGIWHSARNRWLWLAINLASAFVISRIVGAFETTIAQLVALASLMPIVASVAGNTGNQTTAIVIRSIALDQIHAGNIYHLFRKELGISALNGLVWGLVVALFAYVFYQNPALSMVVGVAMMLTFMLAALFGVSAPLLLEKMGRDPAMGASVILTGVTDALGFLVFLSLAALFLV